MYDILLSTFAFFHLLGLVDPQKNLFVKQFKIKYWISGSHRSLSQSGKEKRACEWQEVKQCRRVRTRKERQPPDATLTGEVFSCNYA